MQSYFFILIRLALIAVGMIILSYGIALSFEIGIAMFHLGLGVMLVATGACIRFRKRR